MRQGARNRLKVNRRDAVVLAVASLLLASGCSTATELVVDDAGSEPTTVAAAAPPAATEPDTDDASGAGGEETTGSGTDEGSGPDAESAPDAEPTVAPPPEPEAAATVKPEPTAAPETPDPETPADDSEPEPTPAFAPHTDSASLLAADACQIPEAAFHGGVGVGFPRYNSRLPTSGSVNALVLFADFDDEPATRTPEEVFEIVSPGGELFLNQMSYDTWNLELTPHFEWLRMSKPSSFYSDAIIAFDTHRDNLQEAIDLADDAVDFSGVDVVILLNNPDAEAIAYGPTFLGHWGENGYLVADGHKIANGITSGHDLLNWGFMWLPHEMGHSLGLADLYSYEGLPGFTGRFSMMNDIGEMAPEYLAWERWQLDWIHDEQILCLEGGSLAVFLEAIELAGDATKAVVVPVGPTRAVVVESRRAIGFDSPIGDEEGAIVYVVDSSILTGYGPIEVVNGKRELRAGESVSVEGVTVEVLANNHDGDIVWVGVDG